MMQNICKTGYYKTGCYATQLFKPNIRCWTKYAIGFHNFIWSCYPLQHFSAISPQLHKIFKTRVHPPAPKKQTNKQKPTLGASGDKATLV